MDQHSNTKLNCSHCFLQGKKRFLFEMDESRAYFCMTGRRASDGLWDAPAGSEDGRRGFGRFGTVLLFPAVAFISDSDVDVTNMAEIKKVKKKKRKKLRWSKLPLFLGANLVSPISSLQGGVMGWGKGGGEVMWYGDLCGISFTKKGSSPSKAQ